MKIETKFNIGESFWPITQRYSSPWISIGECIATQITVYVVKGRNKPLVSYRGVLADPKRNFTIVSTDDDDCLYSSAKAQAECDIRNKIRE